MGIDFECPEYMLDKGELILLQDFVEMNREVLEDKRLLIFGAGVRGSIFGMLLQNEGIPEFDYCDNNEIKWGGTIGTHIIISPKELQERVNEYVVLVSVESRELADVMENQLCEMGFEKGKNLFSLPSEIYDKYLDEFFKPIKDHVLVMGDCRFTFVSIADENTETLDDILRKEFAGRGIPAKVLSMHALCMRPQYYMLKKQFEKGNIPRTLILPINYETYNGTTHLLSSSQHTELMRRMYECAGREDCELEEYVQLTKQRTENPPFIFSVENENGSAVVSDKKLRIFLKMSYMFEPDLESEGVEYLKKTLLLAQEYGVKVLTFAPPLNYMSGKEYWGDAFVSMYQKGLEVFKQIILEYGGMFLDQSFLLTEEGFYSKYDKNELANYEGRVQMANSLMDFLKESEENED